MEESVSDGIECGSVAEHGGGGAGRAAVWVRYGGDFRDDAIVDGVVSSDAAVAGSNGIECAGGNDCGVEAGGDSGRKMGTAGQFADIGAALSDYGDWMRAGVELDGAGGISLDWRAGDRRIVGAGPDVHCGDCSGEISRAAGGIVSVQCGVWNFAGVLVELCDWDDRAGYDGVAVEAGDCGGTGGGFFGDAVLGFAGAAGG